MTDTSPFEGTDARERIDRYLEQSGLTSHSPRVVPLTGDASDRRYFRILMSDVPSIVLALYAAPFDLARLSFANVARLFATMPVPTPELVGQDRKSTRLNSSHGYQSRMPSSA